MATKGIQANGALQVNIQKAEEGQALKRAARKARKGHTKAAVVVVIPYLAEGAAIHALFSRTTKTLGENHVSRNPVEVLKRSPEMRKAMAIHGHENCLRRCFDACVKFGMSEEAAAKFATEACS